MKCNRCIALAFMACAVITAAAIAQLAGVPAFEMSEFTIDSGGGTLVGSDFELNGTIGQHDASTTVLSGGGFEVIGGFWAGAGKRPASCPADLNGDSVVGVPDLLLIINHWGPCPAPPQLCPEDFRPDGGDGTVGVSDLLGVINAWGVCAD